MNLKQGITLVIMTWVVMLPLSGRANDHMLKTSEVRGVMAEMLEQHIDQRALTQETMELAIRHYVELGDRDHLYLLDSEAQSFLKEDSADIATAMEKYQQDAYPSFEAVNKQLQSGIYRARHLRHFDQNERAALFEDAEQRFTHNQPVITEQHADEYPRNEAELTQRLKDSFKVFVMDEMDRFGAKDVMSHQDVVANKYETYLQRNENEYLYVGDHGEPLTTAEQENLFSMHILKAFAKSLDAHSSFLDEGEAQDMKMRLEKGFEGIGVVVSELIDGFVISDLLADSPAQRSGQVKINDRLVSINGKSLAGMTLAEVIDLVRGGEHKGEVVTLGLLSGGSSSAVDVSLKPEMIIINKDRVDVSFERFQNGIIGHLTLHSFYEGPKGISAVQDLSDGIDKLRKEGNLIGLVLDLRENSGGYLSQAVKVAGLFIQNGVVVMSKYNNGEEHFYRHVDGTVAYDGPLVILTSRLTASAAEIVAASLQDYGVALVVGDEHTYGKGTIQAQTVTEEGSKEYFKVTVGKYYTVSGHTTQIRGVLADVRLPGEYSQLQIGESYLGTNIANDVIPPAYDDTLQDIEPRAKQWYIDHYLPQLQKKVTFWQGLLPEIQRRSVARTEGDQKYQMFLQRLVDVAANNPVGAEDGFDVRNYQVKEATRIVGDMIQLRDQSVLSAKGPTNSNIERIGAER